MLQRSLAPITNEAWEEIDSRAKDVLKAYLSARKVVNVNGPKGWDYTVVPEGRLDIIDDSEVKYGTYKVKPLVEARVEFELERWELDNLVRGAKDIELDALEEAVKKAALFEEEAIYNGNKKVELNGLVNESDNEKISLGNDPNTIMAAISEGVLKLREAFSDKPYTLVVGKEAWKRLNMKVEGYPLIKQVEDLLGTKVVFSHVLDGAILIPYDHEDLEMTIGNDFSIGYQSTNGNKVKFFITESFTFRILDKALIVKFTL
ncbi:family 1 encapsulin nanocompartment shell protein [Sporosalibacterium faouarense]|uniref:family 1 encapsulin nanocompartment shell protein n=1 Tax=Sporosalibacterium faouarense TaxID=516123 RepID=UPI00141C2928|nr:family 1 encapsulin nanocompartment shell protein [Sporosalibacterium faouarense]MTI46353.1 bacteriocin [Bacillota bacterium]